MWPSAETRSRAVIAAQAAAPFQCRVAPRRCWRHAVRRGPMAPRALFGDLLQKLWQAEEEGTDRRSRQTEQDITSIRRLLDACRREQALQLSSSSSLDEFVPTSSSSLQSLEQQEAMVAAALHADPSAAASNAVPFSSSAISSPPEAFMRELPSSSGNGSSSSSEATPATPRVEAVRPILPCLFAAEGKLDTRGAESLATQLALSQLQVLDFARVRDGQARCLPDNVFWCGPQPFPTCRVAAAAILHRMVARLGGLRQGLPEVFGSAILMVYPQQDRQLAAETVALYLYLYCGFDLEQAAKEAQKSMGAKVDPADLLPCMEELAGAVAGWQRRVRLVWPYGGGRVELKGEAVGGWDRKVALAFDVRRRIWELWLWGLEPGVYRCKFFVDGRWCIDMAAPTENDGRGNVNNVIVAPEDPLPGLAGDAAGSGSGVLSSVTDDGGRIEILPYDGPQADSASGGGGAPAAAAAAAPPPSTEATAAAGVLGLGGLPPLQVSLAELGAAREEASGPQAVGPDWGSQLVGQHSSDIVRFGARLLAFYTKLAVQRRLPGSYF